jgi:dolichol-phosphate mannosyltransferase
MGAKSSYGRIRMISVVIPVFNEEEMLKQYDITLYPIIERLEKQFQEEFEVVLVDDRSKDRSWDIISELSATKGNTKKVRHEHNRGMGGAIKTGIGVSRGNLLVFLDADLTFRPEDISILLTEFRKNPADCISGSPYLLPGLMSDVQGYRMILSRTVNILYRILLGRHVTSISPIFRLYKRQVFDSMSLSSENFEINAEILSKMIFLNLKIVEVPVALHERKFGESKARLTKSAKNHITVLYKIFCVKYLGRDWT